MLKKSLLILSTLLIGATVGVLVFVILARGTSHQQLVGSQPLSYWLLCLDADQATLRTDAETALPQFGLAAVGPLIQRLDVPQSGTVESASVALVTIGAPAVPQLGASLHSGSPARRIAVITVLRGIGPASAAAVPDIASLLEDPNAGAAATEYFQQYGAGSEAVAAAARCLAGTDHHRRLDAIRVLAEAPSDPRTADALVLALKTTDPGVRDAAYTAICDLPVPPSGAVETMIEHLTNLETRSSAVAALAKSGTSALEPLSRLQQNPNEEVRLDAINLIRLIQIAHGGGATDCLDRFLNDGSAVVRARARTAINDVREAGGLAAHTLSQPQLLAESGDSPRVLSGPVMPDPDSLHLDPAIDVPPSQAAALDTPDVVTAITELDDPNQPVREMAEQIVKNAWPIRGQLPDYTKTTDPPERLRRVRLLPFASDWKKYDLMISAANDDDPSLRRAAIGAMGRSLQAPRCVEKLIDLARHGRTPSIRQDAIAALAPAYKNLRVTPVLRQAMSDPDPSVAAAAQAALEKGTPMR